MGLYEKVARLPLAVEGLRLEPLRLKTPGFERATTVIRLQGGDFEGVGEDVNWRTADHEAFRSAVAGLDLSGSYTLDDFSRRLDAMELGPGERLYRRWAFESAALDLALQQADRSLADVLERPPRPVSFVASMSLGSPAATTKIQQMLTQYPQMQFKVDMSESWTTELVAQLRATGAIRVVDLKGLYRGNFSGPAPNAQSCQWVVEQLPQAWIEDPALDHEPTRELLDRHRGRVSWDANIHAVADIVELPFEPGAINIKPSRFGLLSELLRSYEYCQARKIPMYGGGQFELGPGRGQIQHLASLFHPDGPNDVAPVGFHGPELAEDLPESPLPPPMGARGFS